MGKEIDPGGWQSIRRRNVQAGVISGFSILTLASAFAGCINQQAIDRDTASLRAAATDDGVIIEQLASGIRRTGDKRSVLADIVVRNCVFTDAELTIANGSPEIEEYSLYVNGNPIAFTDAKDLGIQLPGLLADCTA